MLQSVLAGDLSISAIEVVPTVAEADELLKIPERFDLVLSNLHLPDGSGLDLLSRIRQRRLPLAFVIFADVGDQHTVVAALRRGADDYVLKYNDDFCRLSPILQAALARHRERAFRLDHMLAAHPSVLFWWRYIDNSVVYPPLWVSDNILDILGYTKEEGVDQARVMEHIVSPRQKEGLRRFKKQLFEAGRGHLDVPFPHKTGRMLWIRIDGRIIKRDSESSGEFISTWTDITEHKEVELRLVESETKYRIITESMEDVLWQVTPDLVYLYVSPSVERQLGYKPEEMIGRPVFEFLSDDMKVAARKGLTMLNLALDDGNGPSAFSGELREARQMAKDGRQVWLETKVTTIVRDGKIMAYQGISRDVTARKALEERMNFLTYHDSLTNLPNRRFFERHLQHALQSARDSSQKAAILLVDLDNFKTINESFGHIIGDELLKKVAERLVSILRPGDILARLGGDEFGVLLPQLGSTDDVNSVAQAILDSLGQVMDLPGGGLLDIGASVGISLFPGHAQTVGELVQYADSALYRAKAEGRHTFRHFTGGLAEAVRERLHLESNLRYAIERGELEVYYQPIVEISSGNIVGAEALLRWHRPDGALIMPDRFIPVAEESGLIFPIGEWVLKTACTQMQQWNARDDRSLFISVNLSPRQFSQHDLADRVGAIIKETQLPPALLRLEITESALIPGGQYAGVLLGRLKETGIQLAIDDFGTGYSSLAYLQRFPIDTLKIDKRFVQNLAERKDDIAIVSAIIRLAKSLNLSLLAEGVETREQLQFLDSQGCTLYQGFLRNKAVRAEEFARLLEMDCDNEGGAI